MLNYLKGLALLVALLGLLTLEIVAGPLAVHSLDLARASVHSLCGPQASGFAIAACRTLARVRQPRSGATTMRG